MALKETIETEYKLRLPAAQSLNLSDQLTIDPQKELVWWGGASTEALEAARVSGWKTSHQTSSTEKN